MDNTNKKPTQKKPKKSNSLLTCFGFSFEPVLEGENPSKMVINITPTKKKKILNGNNNKKKNNNLIRLFSSSPGLEEVPGGRKSPAASKSKKRTGDDDDNSSTGDSDHERNRRSNRKSSSLKGADPKANQKPPRWSPEMTSEENPSDQTTHGAEESIVVGNRRPERHVEAGEGDRCQKRQSFARKIDAIRSPKSQPGSPEIKPKPDRMAHGRLSQITKSAVQPVVKFKTISEDPSTGSRNCDSMIGMSIILLTLSILLLWGRVCAVLCTCAWLYFVPLLRTMVGQDGTSKLDPGRVEPDFDSEEYKKRVVLEGFLERRHRSRA